MKFFIFVVLVSVIVIFAGIYKFNYSDDDIYVKDVTGKYIHMGTSHNEHDKK